MFKPGASLTSLRPVGTQGPLLNVSPTKGNLRFNPVASDLLVISSGDHVDFTIVDGVFYVSKSPKLTEMVEGVEKEVTVGAKLRANENAPLNAAVVLTCSSQNVWEQLKGSSTTSSTYKVETEPQPEYDENDKFVKNWYALTFVKTEQKTERKRKNSEGAGNEEDFNTSDLDGFDIQEEEEEEDINN